MMLASYEASGTSAAFLPLAQVSLLSAFGRLFMRFKLQEKSDTIPLFIQHGGGVGPYMLGRGEV
jgi:hypothetical protein